MTTPQTALVMRTWRSLQACAPVVTDMMAANMRCTCAPELELLDTLSVPCSLQSARAGTVFYDI